MKSSQADLSQRMKRENNIGLLDGLSRLIDKALLKSITPSKDTPEVVYKAVSYSLFPGGKRFRPLLCLGACKAVGGRVADALNTACALEMIHAYSLVHDDLPAMDNAATRRGKPSCHKKFGEANAILAGDALLTKAFEALSENKNANSLSIIRAIAKASADAGLVGGQALDLSGSTATQPQIEKIAKLKTASLISASVVAGGLCAEASSAQINLLRSYGKNLGLAFQLMDDVHDSDGLVKIKGVQFTSKKALFLINLAKRSLKNLKGDTAVLNELADWISRI